MEAVAAGFSPEVWYRTPKPAVSSPEDTRGRRKEKQTRKKQTTQTYLLKSLKNRRGNVHEYSPPSKINAISQLMTLSE